MGNGYFFLGKKNHEKPLRNQLLPCRDLPMNKKQFLLCDRKIQSKEHHQTTQPGFHCILELTESIRVVIQKLQSH
jgi:hypothetical protein